MLLAGPKELVGGALRRRLDACGDEIVRLDLWGCAAPANTRRISVSRLRSCAPSNGRCCRSRRRGRSRSGRRRRTFWTSYRGRRRGASSGRAGRTRGRAPPRPCRTGCTIPRHCVSPAGAHICGHGSERGPACGGSLLLRSSCRLRRAGGGEWRRRLPPKLRALPASGRTPALDGEGRGAGPRWTARRDKGVEQGAGLETAAGRRCGRRRPAAPAAAKGKIERPSDAAHHGGVIPRVGPARSVQPSGAVDVLELDGVACHRTSAVRVVWAALKLRIAPRLSPNVFLAGKPRLVAKLHRPLPGGS